MGNELSTVFALSTAEAVRKFEAVNSQLPQIDLQTRNEVWGGMIARTIFVPAGTAITGAMTNLDNICVLFGDITVTTDEGQKRLTGFHVLPANGGHKRAGFAHQDTWWTTVWKTDKTDVIEIEDEMTDESDQLQTRQLLGADPLKEIE